MNTSHQRYVELLKFRVAISDITTRLFCLDQNTINIFNKNTTTPSPDRHKYVDRQNQQQYGRIETEYLCGVLRQSLSKGQLGTWPKITSAGGLNGRVSGGGAGRRTPLVVKRSRALKVYNTDRAKSFNTMTLNNQRTLFEMS